MREVWDGAPKKEKSSFWCKESGKIYELKWN